MNRVIFFRKTSAYKVIEAISLAVNLSRCGSNFWLTMVNIMTICTVSLIKISVVDVPECFLTNNVFQTLTSWTTVNDKVSRAESHGSRTMGMVLI